MTYSNSRNDTATDKKSTNSLKIDIRFAGRVAILGSILFFCTFVLLGLIQPGYDMTRDTVSMLVLGKWGWVQSANFLMMAGTVLIFGLGLGWSIYKNVINPVSVIFTLFATGFVIGTIFPTNPATPSSLNELSALSMTEKIHELMAFSMIILAPLLLYPIFVSLKNSPQWRSLLPYTVGVFVFNCIVGWLWIYLLGYDWFWEWKGLLQKILITNILVWLVVMGRRLMKYPIQKTRIRSYCL